MVLIFAERTTPRLQYTCDTLFPAIGTRASITNDFCKFEDYNGPRIHYAAQHTTGAWLHIRPHTLLFESDVQPQAIDCSKWNDYTIFFQTAEGDIPFDIFAASFYLLTCYQQYLPHTKDEYGRFAHTNSLAYQQGFLHLPLVNLWWLQLAELLKTSFPNLSFTTPDFRFVPTYDIDMAWSYKSKGLLRNLGGWGKDVASAKWSMAIERLQVLLRLTPDPFDVFDWLDGLHALHGVQPIYFFLLAQRTGRYDKNVDPSDPAFRQRIRQLAQRYATGIHPSWRSGDETESLSREISTLQNVTGKKVQLSRQHYIRIKFPATYRALISAGIQHDYSLGYGSINGFAASFAMPFYWFDVLANTPTKLMLHPFCFMDANAIFEEKLSPQQALESLEHYYQITRQVSGSLVTIFHNHLLTTQPGQGEWRALYQRFLEKYF